MGIGVLGCSDGDMSGDPVGMASTVEQREFENLKIQDYLARRGIDLADVVLGDEKIRVEGDILMLRGSLLYQIEQEDADASEFQEKAYWFSGISSKTGEPVSVPKVAGLGFSFASNVPTRWRDAFRAAAAEWNKTACIRFSESSSGLISVVVGAAGIAANGKPFDASAEFPRTDRGTITVGRRVTIDTGSTTWTNPAIMKALMMHEIGHLLGFHHPRSGVHLPGTAASTTGCGSPCVASYPTVMDYLMTESTLTADDLKAANLIYKKRPAGPHSRTPVCQ